MNISKKIAKNYLISIGYNVKGIINIENYTDINSEIKSYGIRFNVKNNIKNNFNYILIQKNNVEKYILLQLRKNKLKSLD